MAGPFYAEGRYVVEVTDQAMGKSSNGNPQFALRFKVLGTPDPENPENYLPVPRQYERTMYRSITDKTIDWFIEDLRTLGFTGRSFRDLTPGGPAFCDFRGKTVEMVCSYNEYNGQTREQWNVARDSSGSLQVQELEAAKLRELDNLFGKQLRTLAPAAPAPAAPKPNGANGAPKPGPQRVAQPPAAQPQYAPGVDDDSIPF